MKTAVFFLFLCSFTKSFSQVQSGTLVDSGRKLTSEATFSITDKHTEGTVFLLLSVNNKGEVTAVSVDEGTTISSTPSLLLAKNAAKKLRFTAGTKYQKFEHVRVKYTLVKE